MKLDAATTKNGVRRAGIYRRAARRIQNGENHWSCCAIACVEDASDPLYYEDDRMLVGIYERFFRPDGAHTFWGSAWSDRALSCDDDNGDAQAMECRILALCFMAAMVEAGDA